MMRALVYTATYGAGPRQETLDSVRAQKCEGRWDYEVGWHNPYGEGVIANVTAQMERARKMAMTGGYDALLSVEHDMLIPPDALQKLWDTFSPVAYGVYLFRHGVGVLNAYEKYPSPSSNPGESLSLKPRLLARARQRQVIDVSGVGFGCTLIRREVLAKVPFRHRPTEMNGTDTIFAGDCLKSGVKQVAHFGVLCGHWNGHRWLMPFAPDDQGRVWVRALQDVTVRIGVNSMPLRNGRDYELPMDEVGELARAGYVCLAPAGGGI